MIRNWISKAFGGNNHLDEAIGAFTPSNVSSGAVHHAVAWKTKLVTASGVVPELVPGSVYGGAVCTVGGTGTTVTCYDEATADATASKLIYGVSATVAVGESVGPVGRHKAAVGVVPPLNYGVVINEGLNFVIGGTGSPSFLILYR